MLTWFLFSRKALTPGTSLDVIAVVADDCFPALHAREIVALLAWFTGPDLWPSNSPDLNPVDYKVWRLMQEHMYKSPIKDVSKPKQQLIEDWSAMRQRVIDEAIDEWRKRLHCCVSAEGGHFEYKLWHLIRHCDSEWFYSDCTFLPARRYASAGLCDSDVSVCPDVCPSHASIVPSRAKSGSWSVHRLIAPSLTSFWQGMIHRKIRKGSSPKERAKWGWVGFFRRFSTNMSSYLENSAF